MAFNDKVVLKVFQRLESGINPDLEIGRFLHHNGTSFPCTLPLYGAVEYRSGEDEPLTVAVLHELCAQHGHRLAIRPGLRWDDSSSTSMTQPVESRPALASARIAVGVGRWRRPGARPRICWARHSNGPACWAAARPSCTSRWPRTTSTRRSRPSRSRSFTSGRSINRRASWPCRRFNNCGTGSNRCQPTHRRSHAKCSTARRSCSKRFAASSGQRPGRPPHSLPRRLHLSHVLYTGKDFLIVDFEGRATHCHFRAAHQALAARRSWPPWFTRFSERPSQALLQLPSWASPRPRRWPSGGQAADFWLTWSSSAFLRAYTAVAGTAPTAAAVARAVGISCCSFHLMAEAVEELQSELNDSAPARWRPR